MIEMEDTGSFWLIDLGSSNGTLLNKRRIHQPTRLRDQDHVAIGGYDFTFHQPRGKPSAELRAATPLLTLQEVENIACWLLVADIRDFTPLSRSVTSQELALLVSRWFATCKQIIENHGGAVNKYLGDGLLAYWQDGQTTAQQMAELVAALKEAQARGGTAFRFVLHFGTVALGGIAAMREETLMGSDVNLAFRLEKLAGGLNILAGMSHTAQQRLAGLVSARFVGEHELKGFEGKHGFFAA